MKEQINQIEKLISKDELSKSLELMQKVITSSDEKTKNEILSLLARLSFLSKNYTLNNTINFKEFSIEISKIRIAIINLKDYVKQRNSTKEKNKYDIIIQNEKIDLPIKYKNKSILIKNSLEVNSKVKFINCQVFIDETNVSIIDNSELFLKNCNAQITLSNFQGENTVGKSLTLENSDVCVTNSNFHDLSQVEIKNCNGANKINFNKCRFYDFNILVLENESSEFVTLNTCQFYDTPIYMNCINTIIQMSQFYDDGIQIFIGDEKCYIGLKKCDFYNSKNGIELYIHSNDSTTTIIGSKFYDHENGVHIFMDKSEDKKLKKGQIKIQDTVIINSSKFFECKYDIRIDDLEEKDSVQNKA